MRIITGSARGIALKTLEGERTRPTAEKVKEAIFSALQFDLEGRTFLDLFAGSGQMGLEALSRGAVRAVFIDEGRDAMEIIKENAKKTGFFEKSHFLVSDYRNYLRKAAGRETFDIVFIDPPYAERIAATYSNLSNIDPRTVFALIQKEEFGNGLTFEETALLADYLATITTSVYAGLSRFQKIKYRYILRKI